MGCVSSKVEVQAPRRRLSLGFVAEGESPQGGAVVEDAAQLLMAINDVNQFCLPVHLQELLTSSDAKAEAKAGTPAAAPAADQPVNRTGSRGKRRMSFESSTDKDMHRRASFSMKDTTAQELTADGNQSSGGEAMTPEVMGKEMHIGVQCMKGLKPEAPNQDSFCVLFLDPEIRIYGVFDGHGSQGHHVSNFVKATLPRLILSDSRLHEETPEVMKDAFVKVQAMIRVLTQQGKVDARMSGTTCTICVHFLPHNKIYTAHVGDSRCVTKLGGDYKDVTEDHKPELPNERKRIEKAGGQVRFDGYYNHRVYSKDPQIRGPGLNMSRALGDLGGHDHAGISCVPDVVDQIVVSEQTGGDIVLVCSDGVWEFIDSRAATELVEKYPPEQALEAAKDLTQTAWDHWRSHAREVGNCVDDITAIVVYTEKHKDDGN